MNVKFFVFAILEQLIEVSILILKFDLFFVAGNFHHLYDYRVPKI